jgi:hypothetical protein
MVSTGGIRRLSSRARIDLRQARRNLRLSWRSISGRGDTWSWKRFHTEVRSRGCSLLAKLSDFSGAILVSGCQRSGTTILARIIRQSDGIVDFQVRGDDELDAALILSGVEGRSARGRYCFQTTYVNECYREYLDEAHDFKLVWVLRNPLSVVYSMKYNWSRFAFNELYEACGRKQLEEDLGQGVRHGRILRSKTIRACLSYNAKQRQAMELMEGLGRERMMIVEYEGFIADRWVVLPAIYNFIHLPYQPRYAESLRTNSLKKADFLSESDREIVHDLCFPVYERMKRLAGAHESA